MRKKKSKTKKSFEKAYKANLKNWAVNCYIGSIQTIILT